MNSETIVMCVVALILGMLLAHMLKDVCGCKTVEGLETACGTDWHVCDLPGQHRTGKDCCNEYECLDVSGLGDGGPPACAPTGTDTDMDLLRAFMKNKPDTWEWDDTIWEVNI